MAQFGFAAPDYLIRAQAGLPVDPANGDQPVPMPAATPAAMPAGLPQAGMPPQSQGFKPGLWDILQGYLFKGQSPADAAMAARSRNYQAQQMAMMGRMLQQATPAELKAILTNPAKYGEEFAKNFAPVQTSEGATETMFGGPGAGGSRFVAPKLVHSDQSDSYGTQSAGGYAPTGSGGGKFTVGASGAEENSATGLTGRTVSLPQIVAPGSVPNTFTPTVTGFGGPTAPSAQPAPVSVKPGAAGVVDAQGHFDPTAFTKSFILPHEGGWNARDLNGSPTKFGINAASNPGVDVANLTPEGATAIYTGKYFPASGSAHLPPALAAVNFDTSIINPKKAQEFLAQSGGDPSKYMDMREAWLGNLVQKFPAAQKYAQAWSSRNADLRTLAGQLGGGAQDGGQAASATGFSGPSTKHPEIIPANDPIYDRLPPGMVLQRSPAGEVSPMPGTGVTYDQRVGAKLALEKTDDVTDYRKANTAWGAMLNAAVQPQGGMRAYAMRDTFARLINPGAVARSGTIEAIKQSQGVPENLRAYFLNLKGDGDVPPATLQQILDVSHGFLLSHYSTAKGLIDSFAQQATRNKIDPRETTPEIRDTPPAPFIPTPPPREPAQRKVGVYATPKGPLEWTGRVWIKPY